MLDDQNIKTQFELESTDNCSELLPHNDQLLRKEPVDLFSLAVIESNGVAKTFVFEADKIYGRLSMEVREVLEMPLFGWNNVLRDRDVFSEIFFRKNGVLCMNFDCDINGLYYNFDGKNISRESVDVAVNNLLTVVSDMWNSGEMESFNIKTGDILFIKNLQCLHGRESLASGDVGKRTLLRSYFCESVAKGLVEVAQGSPLGTEIREVSQVVLTHGKSK